MSTLVQGTIWYLSLLSIPMYFHDMLNNLLNNPFMYYTTFIFGAVTLFQQMIVYKDIHALETNRNEENNVYGEWVNKFTERSFRYLLFLSLLFGAGKITGAIYPWIRSKGNSGHLNNGVYDYGNTLYNWISPIGINHGKVFVFGALSVFFILILWNIGAIYHQRKSIESTENNKSKKNWISVRIICFIASASFAFIYWVLCYWVTESVGWFSILSVGAYCFFAIIAALLNFKKILNWISNKILLNF